MQKMIKSFKKSLYRTFNQPKTPTLSIKNVNHNTIKSERHTSHVRHFQGVTPNNMKSSLSLYPPGNSHIPPGKKFKFIFNKMPSKRGYDMLVPRMAIPNIFLNICNFRILPPSQLRLRDWPISTFLRIPSILRLPNTLTYLTPASASDSAVLKRPRFLAKSMMQPDGYFVLWITFIFLIATNEYQWISWTQCKLQHCIQKLRRLKMSEMFCALDVSDANCFIHPHTRKIFLQLKTHTIVPCTCMIHVPRTEDRHNCLTENDIWRFSVLTVWI